jgi:hypothetical protein
MAVAFDCARLRALLESDPEFRLAAREWDAVLLIAVGPSAYSLRLDRGVPTACAQGAPDNWTVRIAAPDAEWEQLLAAVPRPFYQHLAAAASRHDVTVEGDWQTRLAYDPALERLVALLREARLQPAEAS